MNKTFKLEITCTAEIETEAVSTKKRDKLVEGLLAEFVGQCLKDSNMIRQYYLHYMLSTYFAEYDQTDILKEKLGHETDHKKLFTNVASRCSKAVQDLMENVCSPGKGENPLNVDYVWNLILTHFRPMKVETAGFQMLSPEEEQTNHPKLSRWPAIRSAVSRIFHL